MFGCLYIAWSQAPVVQMEARGLAILMRWPGYPYAAESVTQIGPGSA